MWCQICSFNVFNLHGMQPNQVVKRSPPRRSESCGAGGTPGSSFCCCFRTHRGRGLSKCVPPLHVLPPKQQIARWRRQSTLWAAARADSVRRASPQSEPPPPFHRGVGAAMKCFHCPAGVPSEVEDAGIDNAASKLGDSNPFPRQAAPVPTFVS